MYKMFVRSSKFRHVFGNAAKKEQCYEGIRVTKSTHDSNFCAVNRRFLAVVVESVGGGAFVVIPIEKTGRVDVNIPKVCGHRSPITDIKWDPFDDHVIASASEDATIKLWRIPHEGLTENLNEWFADLTGHSKKVSYIEWHPSAGNVLLSAAADLQCFVWNTLTKTALAVISVHRDTIYSISWNRDGSAFATTCKDRIIRVIDPRTGRVTAEGEGHQGTKASKVVFLGKNRLFTTGFSKHSERQFALWDTSNLSKPLKIEDIDSSSGLLIPFYDFDTSMVYLAGKGDGNIRYFEVVDSPPYVHFLSQYQSATPQRGLGMLPKCGVDVTKCEIVRFYKLHTQKDFCEPISMIVPRKSEMFQADIYPPTAGSNPALTVDQWISGVNKDPLLVSLKDGSACSAAETTMSSAVNSNVKISSQKLTLSMPAVREQTSNNMPQGRVNRLAETSSFDNANFNSPQPDIRVDLTRRADSTSTFGANNTATNSKFDCIDSGIHLSRATLSFGGTGDNKAVGYDYTITSAASAVNPTSVKRMSSMTSSSSDRTPRTRLSRNSSDVSDLSTTTPLTTPVGKPRPRRVRQRNDDDSSSCSSTEAISQSVDDIWRDNPLYATQHQGRRRHSPRRRAANATRSQTINVVDTGPLDDLLIQTAVERDRFVSRSNAELHLASATAVGNAAGTQVPISLLTSTFKSEPDVAMANLSIADENLLVDSGRSTMIDCISVEAPDDTVIKPSRLRASMNSRHRRTPVSATSADDLSISSQPSAGGITVRRVGSLRDVPPSRNGLSNDAVSNAVGFERGLWKTASLRDSRPLSQQQDNNSSILETAQQPAVPKTSTGSLGLSNSGVQSSQSVILQGSTAKVSSFGSVSSPGGTNNQFTFVIPADVARRRAAVQDVLPSYNRNPIYTNSSSVNTTITLADKPRNETQTDCTSAVTYEQLLLDYHQLQEKFSRQQDELRVLKEQSAQKDLKIRRLEDQLRQARTLENGSRLYHGHKEAVIAVKGHVGNTVGVKGVC